MVAGDQDYPLARKVSDSIIEKITSSPDWTGNRLPVRCMELGNLLVDTREVRLEEIEVSQRVDEVQHAIWSELKSIEYFAQDRLHCMVCLNTYVTIDGHTSI